jgi:hypothetical protein
MIAELTERVGRKRHLLKLAAPLAKRYLHRVAPGAQLTGAYADPWRVIGKRWGDPSPDLPGAPES